MESPTQSRRADTSCAPFFHRMYFFGRHMERMMGWLGVFKYYLDGLRFQSLNL